MREYAYFWFWLLLLLFALQSAYMAFRRGSGEGPARVVAWNVTAAGLVMLAALAAGEGWFYFVRDTTDGYMLTLSSQRWLDRHVTTNRQGFRDPPFPTAKGRLPTERRICALGDSFTYGQGVARIEDRWTGQLAQGLRQSGRDVRILNLSYLGWTTNRELRAFERFQPTLDCDAVILGYVLNDHDDLFEFPPEMREVVQRVQRPAPWVSSIVKRSLLLDFLYVRLTFFRFRDVGDHDAVLVAAYEQPEVWQKHTRTLARLHEQVAARGADFVVATFPRLGRPWDEYAFAPVHEKLGAFWRGRDAMHVDLWPHFRTHPAADLRVGRFDPHPNELAQSLAARALLNEAFASEADAP